MKSSLVVALGLVMATSVASAAPKVRLDPKTARPGDAVLVTVTGVTAAPKGTANDKPLTFFRAKQGYQALFAIPLGETDDSIDIDIDGVKQDLDLAVKPVEFPEANVVVEDELANPGAADRKTIDADNAAIVAATNKQPDAPLFAAAFVRPGGAMTSPFGEWRTFNDGHRSQHLGFDVVAKTGAAVKVVNTGTITLVRDTLLGGLVVVVAHGGGIASAYFHLSESDLKEGDFVQRGQVIARAGATGRTTGPHLHLAMHVAGGFVDPVRFMRLKITPSPSETRAAARRAKKK